MTVEVLFSCADRHERIYHNSWSCPVCEMRFETEERALINLLHASGVPAPAAGKEVGRQS